MHHLEDAREKGRGLKRAHALLLEQVSKRIDLAGEFAKRIVHAGSAGAEGVITFAQGRDDVGERLERANHGFDERRGDKGDVQKQTAEEKNGGGNSEALR